MAASTTRLELVTPVRAEHPDRAAIEKTKEWYRQTCIDEFSTNLEIARIIFRRHPELVTCAEFPEPYRSCIISHDDYDPEDDHLSVSDEFLTDPEGADAKAESFAREAAEARADEANKAAAALAKMPVASSAVQ
jgi:hypothetical protein